MDMDMDMDMDTAIESQSKKHGHGEEADNNHFIAKFCNSKWINHRMVNNDQNHTLAWTFEGTSECNATTPLGGMIACPGQLGPRKHQCARCELDSDRCDTVYVGHNDLGEEVHWLPPTILQRWWKNNWAAFFHRSKAAESIEHDLLTLSTGNYNWCPKLNESRSVKDKKRRRMCSEPLSNRIDTQFKDFWGEVDVDPDLPSLSFSSTSTRRQNFSPL